jgi:4,5-DOPA dioxygenase extradiol
MISSIFVCHGGPTIVKENNSYTDFLKDYGKKINPKAIVIFTAHWESDITTISAIDGTYKTIYDFYGFDRDLYQIKYNAIGSIEVANKVQELLTKQGITSKFDTSRGLDHGSWDVLHLLFPKADIPVVQVSINPRLQMNKQYEIGKALKELGNDDILVIGSGATVHNLATVDWYADKVEPWALEFDNWLIDKIAKDDKESLFNYRLLAPYAKYAVPTEEHFVPLYIAMGSGNNTPKLLHHSYAYGTLSYIFFEF